MAAAAAVASSSHHLSSRHEASANGRVSWPRTRILSISLPNKAVRFSFACNDVVGGNQHHWISKQCYMGHVLAEYSKRTLTPGWLRSRKQWLPSHTARRLVYFTPLASTDDGVAINGTSQASSNNDMEEMRVKLNQSLQGENISTGLVQSIHDAARAIELAIQEHGSSSKTSWFSKTWLGVDKNAWAKTLSYQAAVYSLLQAGIEISTRGEGRDRDVNVFVQRSLLRQSAPLESVIRDELSTKQPAAYEWFWSHQLPMVVTTFVNLFERDPHFTATTMLCWKGEPSGSGSASDVSLLMLALSCLAAVKKLGSAKVSCSQFISMVPDVIGRLMDMLLEFVPIQKAYYSMKDIGLRREFLYHFGRRAATVIYKNDRGVEEIGFWIDLVQNQLQQAIDREKIWLRLTTCESIEVLEKDLAIFGFFIALGRSTQSFLSTNGVSSADSPVEGMIRYLIGGSVLYYPQLSSISSYQLYVEVVCEELEWLPFYQSNSADAKPTVENKIKQEGMPHREAISLVLDVCSYWMTNFIKYSAWLENPSNIKAARFLSRGHSKLVECVKELGVQKYGKMMDTLEDQGNEGSETYLSVETQLDSFDKALGSVEEALIRLEDLLQELHLSNSNPEKEHLKAACSDLERIRKLKKEAEFLEASFRAKVVSLEQGDAGECSTSSASERRFSSNKKVGKTSNENETDRRPMERVVKKPRDFWSFLVQNSTKKTVRGLSTVDQNVTADKEDNQDLELNEIRRFELLRRELIELEKRVQKSNNDAQNEEESELDRKDNHASATGSHMIVQAQKKDNVITKSIEKIKETSTDVWQGTQLLAIDVAAAMVLIKRALTGDELTQKEKKALRRTLTDLASVVPIGFLMLLPVTAVGHAAMLAAIQRYVPALIPSTYAPERLELLRQLEKVKEMENTETNNDEMSDASVAELKK